MQGWMSINKGCLFLLFLLSACTSGDLTLDVATNIESSAHPSSTKLLSRTPNETSTPTPLPTIIPVNTPTEGPPPDLELLNTTIYYHDLGVGTLIGEIRNNTDTPMVFPIDPTIKKDKGHPIFRIITEAWDWYQGQYGDYYYHEVSVGKGGTSSPNTNCFLYPGETGPIIIRSVDACHEFPENCVNNHEEIKIAPEGTGMRLVGYQDLKTYIPWPDLYPDYHPQAKNIIFSVKDNRIDFSFDVQKDFFKGYKYNYTAWMLLYNQNGGLISILFNSRLEKILVEKDGLYHISGFTEPVFNAAASYFRNSNSVMGAQIAWNFSQVDHVRVLVEAEQYFLCGMYTNYDFYRQEMEED
jgi:hypothetical protein